ncbi:hypothetical protein TSUD_356190 [Trifolium subterraneum]|uniref:Malectin-like domain-containing protein n=1 Tax=Trifolium subterraneum TaxID=3900 RepID=A0A2Z6N055_TRISU|nr:hypothetical protein TSUD_356190 [Trifolium subterraneum]
MSLIKAYKGDRMEYIVAGRPAWIGLGNALGFWSLYRLKSQVRILVVPLKAFFYYGNYDNLNQPPQFDLLLGANVWGTVKSLSIESLSVPTSEIIYTPSLNYIQLCLVNTGKGTPFISAIELRPLNNTAYATYSTISVLTRFMRCNLGSNTDVEYRYKYDDDDRIWLPYELSSDWRRLSTSFNNDDLYQNDYKLPAIVMSTAVTPVNESAPLQFHWDADNVNDEYYYYLHFNEVEKLAGKETRTFIITLNGDTFNGPDISGYQVVETIYSTAPVTGVKRYQISLSKTENSTLPPILNAIEIYKVKDFSQLETQQGDVDAMTNIKKYYGVARNWQGDPCAPVSYMWEGLNCSIDDNNIPRITFLDLSSSGLTGKITSSISKLTMLQHL